MEGRTQNAELSAKTRSLDSQSFCDEKSGDPNVQEARVLKRKRWSLTKKREEISSERVEKRRKGRKELSLSSLEDASNNGKKVLDSNELGLKSSSFALFGNNSLKKKKRKKKNGDGTVSNNQNLQNVGSFMHLSHSLDDKVVVVPKRPRGFSGRNKFQSDHVVKPKVNSVSTSVNSHLTTSSSKTQAEFSGSKLNGDPEEPLKSLVGKRKKILVDLKENSSCGTSSLPPGRGGDDDASVKVTSSRAKKRARKNCRKSGKSDVDKQAEEVKWSPVENCVNTFKDLHEDDEENLEQNAARMLSSRFDPSCTGFSGRGAALKSQSADGSCFSPIFDRAFKSLGVDASESETVSDSAGRVLRPRRQRKHKGLFRRRRRHFYEVCSVDMDPYWVVNQRIKVFWPLDHSWYIGIVKDYDSGTKLHYIKYDDRDEEWINLRDERFKLLLLPGEVPVKSRPDKPGIKGCKIGEDVDVNFADENFIANFMESQPIISWLSRSTHRMKFSPLSITKKQTQSRVLKNLPQPIFSENSVAMHARSIDMGPSIPYADKSCMSSVKPDRSVLEDVTEKSLKPDACSSDRKMPLVYYRRRFHNRCQRATDMLVEKFACRSADGSVTLLASVVDSVWALDEFKISPNSSGIKDMKFVDDDISLTSVGNHALLKFPFSFIKSKVDLKLSLPPLWVFDHAFGAESFWLYNTLQFEYGKMVTLWPNVRVEMLFVDNIVGLRLMLFEGCLNQAVDLLCSILTFFHRPNEYRQFEELQLPVTSIRIKLSGLRDIGRPLEFVFYNFLELKGSKWLHLDNKLKRHCIVTKELPLTECTYANIKTLQSGNDTHIAPVCQEPLSFEKRSRRSTMCRNCSSRTFDEKLGRLPPLVLSFAAAPTFFLNLHLNLLMENTVASVSLQKNKKQCLMSSCEHSERFDNLNGDGSSLVCDISNQDLETTIENMWCSLRCAAVDTGWLSCVHSKAEAVANSIVVGTCKKTPQKPLDGALDISGASVGCQGAGKNISDRNVTGPENCPCHTGSWTCVGKSSSSAPDCPSFLEKSENGCLSHLKHISIQTASFNDAEGQLSDLPTQTAKVSQNNLSARTMINGTISIPYRTAPRSMWRRNRNVSRSKPWPDFVSNGFFSKKPGTQVSNMLPFGGYSFGSKPRSHRKKGHRYKKTSDGSTKVSGGSESPHTYPLSRSCDANILVTVGDRGWRECGAQVVLESVDYKDWNILVKIAGVTRYSHKPHQFLQPGITNRYTHAMMWKGGKDWMLEFPDRSQWILFKDMHEECYNWNIRSASVKNIPIPGVRVVDDSDHNSVEVPFIHTQKYFQQIGTEVDMAMDPSRILYDIESDDEEWISKLRSSTDHDGTRPLDISEEIFERVMDMFEKIAYAHQREKFTSDEIEHLMVGIEHVDAIKAIHEHWQQKRLRKGMPLIRQLQPALWERYHNQVKEWELVMNKAHNFSDGCKEKAALPEKPPMFAFCLRPRGLEALDKGTKQRSQRKFMVLGHHSGVFGDTDGLQIPGRKLNGFAVGDERALVIDQSYVSSDVTPLLQTPATLPLNDAVGPGILSMSSDWSERNQYLNLHRNKAKKVGINLSARSSQISSMQFNQRPMAMNNGAYQSSIGLSEWRRPKSCELEGIQRKSKSQLGGPEFDEFRLRDASGAAQHALNMAKLKRERASRLFVKAEYALHKAVIALMTAEAIKVSDEDSNGNG